ACRDCPASRRLDVRGGASEASLCSFSKVLRCVASIHYTTFTNNKHDSCHHCGGNYVHVGDGIFVLMAALAVYDGVALSSPYEPDIYREREDEGNSERYDQASPEKEVSNTRIHRTRNDEHNQIVHDFHCDNRESVGRDCQSNRLPQRYPAAHK